jgi:hypothetical protein
VTGMASLLTTGNVPKHYSQVLQTPTAQFIPGSPNRNRGDRSHTGGPIKVRMSGFPMPSSREQKEIHAHQPNQKSKVRPLGSLAHPPCLGMWRG